MSKIITTAARPIKPPLLKPSAVQPSAIRSSRPAHSLPLLTSRVFGTPLLIDSAKAEVIANVVSSRLPEMMARTQEGKDNPVDKLLPHHNRLSMDDDGAGSCSYHVVNSIAIIDVCGALVNRDTGMNALSGLSSYEQLSHEVSTAATDTGVKAILLRMNSPGGEVSGAFDLADTVAKASKLKPVWASVDDQAFSAAYLLASACQRIYVTRTSGVGSIGVVAMRLDVTKSDASAGVAYNFITAGDRKVDQNPHTEFTDSAEANLQAEVDRIYDLFTAFVSTHRRLSIQSVKATEAGLFFGPNAITAKLADRMGTFQEAFMVLDKQVNGSGQSSSAYLSASAGPAPMPMLDDEEDMPMPGDEDEDEGEMTDGNCGGKKKKKMVGGAPAEVSATEDLHSPAKTTTLPFAKTETTEEIVKMEKTEETKVEATAAPPPAPTTPPAPAATVEATAPVPAAIDTVLAPTKAGMEFIVEMFAVAGINDTAKLQQVYSLGLTEPGVRKHLINMRAELQSQEPVHSTVVPSTSSNPSAEAITALQAQSKSLHSADPSLSEHQHFARLLKSQPSAYRAYLEANPAQVYGNGNA